MISLFKEKGLRKKYPKGGIYFILIKSEFYIGSSEHIGERLDCHKSRLRTNKHENPIFLNYFRKYGEDSCYFKVLEYCKSKDLTKREKYYIDLLDPKLNVERDPVRQNSSYKCKIVYQFDFKGKFIRKHKSTANAERFMKGNTSSISDCCRGNRKSAYGFQWSYDKNFNKIYINNSNKAKSKSVIQLLSKKVINEYSSAAEAVRSLNLTGRFDSNCVMISACCLGKIKQAFGYIWKYK